ncbi:MAG TPA: signal peptidase I [Gemmatimonadales bacterium]|nr:signal peptidase I [Gemmatimonadales bacterium]
MTTRGWPARHRRVVRRGDSVRFAGHDERYLVAQDADADAEGRATLTLETPLVRAVTDGERVAHRRSWRHEAESWAKSIGVALVIWVLLTSYLVEAFRIPSPSMENTLLVGDFLFVEKLVYGGQFQIPRTGIRFLRVPGYGEPRRDGIVVFRSVEDSTPNLNVVKRLVGMPGDTLQMVRDTLIRNGEVLPEPYVLRLSSGLQPDEPFRLRQMREWQLPHYVGPDPAGYRPTTHDWGPIVVPPGHYFVMGDNRDASYDSRYWGFLPRSHIVGRPLFIYFSIATDPLRIRWNRIFRRPR